MIPETTRIIAQTSHENRSDKVRTVPHFNPVVEAGEPSPHFDPVAEAGEPSPHFDPVAEAGELSPHFDPAAEAGEPSPCFPLLAEAQTEAQTKTAKKENRPPDQLD